MSALVSIVIPIKNEEANLPEMHRRLTQALSASPRDLTYEVLFVDDGSTDRSAEIIMGLRRDDPRLKLLALSRNFGLAMALCAGVDHAAGDAVILMDGDLQDPPELIPALIAKWKEGVDVVYAVRSRRRDNLYRRAATSVFYRLLNSLSMQSMPLDTGNFSLMDRQVVDVLTSMPERNRYVVGLRAWAGFRQEGVPYEREVRHGGSPKQTLVKLLKLAFDALFSFSYVPLRVATFMGVAASLVSFSVGSNALYQKLFTNRAIPGWASMLTATTFLGGAVLLTLGILGEYVARIFDEVRARPPYVVARRMGFPTTDRPPRQQP